MRDVLGWVGVVVWLLLAAVIWVVIAIGTAFPPECRGIECLGVAAIGAAVVFVSLVLLAPLTIVVARWYRSGGAAAFPVSAGFFVIGLVWLLVLAVRFPSVVDARVRLRGDAFVYWSIGSLPTIFAWLLAALTARTRRMQTLARYVALSVLLSLVLGAAFGQVTGYATCDLEAFQPCVSWSQTGRMLGAGFGLLVAALVTVAVYQWRERRNR